MIAAANPFSDVVDSVALLLTLVTVALVLIVVLSLRHRRLLAAEHDLRLSAERTARELAASREQLSSVLESTMDSVLVLDRDWQVLYVNHRAAGPPEERQLVAGRGIFELFPELIGTDFDRNYRAAMERQVAIVFEARFDLTGRWWEVHANPTPGRLSVFYREISDRKRAEDQLRHLAEHDELTGLPNRRGFMKHLGEALPTAGPGCEVAVLYLDLDDFKVINDTLGHAVGDAVLKEMAGRLCFAAGASDHIARVGGDEFAVVRTGVTSREQVADLAHRMIATLAAPYPAHARTLRVAGSVGIAFVPTDAADADELFRNADIALYAAKAEGPGSCRFFDPAMADRLNDRQMLKDDLAVALRNGELKVFYQPIVDLRANAVASVEALLRWDHPQRGPILPDRFVPLAEETGLIAEIGKWVLNEACAAASRWPAKVRVAVNLSPVQFRSRSLPLHVAAALSRNGIDPNRLELEITESVLLNDSEANLAILHELRELRVRIALDDFGTGYSSLSYLSRFPFDRIKIDRSFVANIAKREARAIVEAVTGLGRALKMVIVAEGIETPAQLALVRETGCDQAQGFLFSEPVDAEEIPPLIASLGSAAGLASPERRAG
jgi:diguanylate cyclase (GGDEF)-like protein